jgi:hypothetical protein
MSAQGTTIALSPVESALAQLATEVRAAELARVDQAFDQRLQVLRNAYGIPVTAAVHVVPDPRTPGAWLLFLPPTGGADHDALLSHGIVSLDALRALEGAELAEEPAAPLPPELDPAWVPGTPMPNGQLPAHLRPTPRPTRRRELVAAEPVDLGA